MPILKPNKTKIQKVGFIANPDKVVRRDIVRRAASLVREAGRQVLADPDTSRFAGSDTLTLPDSPELASVCDLLLVFGGDGTMLRVARETASKKTPIMGVNTGSLGFLTATPANELQVALKKIWQDRYSIDRMPMLEASTQQEEGPQKVVAMNDVVISRGAIPRLIELEVTVDGEKLTRYRCDGLIISTPAGSTAYSLAAGGAVVTPNADVFTLTPICPHTLSNRSVIISLNARIEIIVHKHRAETFLSADGQVQAELFPSDRVILHRSRQRARLVRLDNRSFFATLRHKLNWSGSSV